MKIDNHQTSKGSTRKVPEINQIMLNVTLESNELN